ncbi:PHP domain-containing protein [Frankia sp. EAN1pec]|uniref:PHP domain-containing protein n=1 Tax=Parafrankia sp. (strain EAN1pec) TaxID=298653 RepID=UPI0012FA0423
MDLHTHSTASDGSVSPAELVRLAAATGLEVLALTDHDTTGGIDRAAAALPAGMTLVPGAEISCRVAVNGHQISMHVLAYLFDRAEPRFAAVRARLREERATHARRMVERLAAAGHPVRWERVQELARGTVGRPHVAAALVEAGLVPDVNSAFSREWIGAGGRFWVEKVQPDVHETLRLIRDAGGVSVFAHPFATSRGETVGPDIIAAMARDGLTGVEVDHPDHTPWARARLREIAADLGLVTTGSSDFHGDRDRRGLGSETTSRENYEALVAKASGSSPIRA